MTETVEKIKHLFARSDIPVFGMTNASSLQNAPPGYGAKGMLESAESILCFGIPVPKGIFKCQGRSEWMYWRAASITYRNMDTILMQVCRMVEEEDEVAVPVYG